MSVPTQCRCGFGPNHPVDTHNRNEFTDRLAIALHLHHTDIDRLAAAAAETGLTYDDVDGLDNVAWCRLALRAGVDRDVTDARPVRAAVAEALRSP